MDEGQIGKNHIDQKVENDRELRKNLQLRDDGISYDYWNTAVTAHLCCGWLMNSSSTMSPDKARELLMSSLNEYISYSEYLTLNGNFKGAKFITTEGKEVQNKLNILAGKIKDFADKDLQSTDLATLATLLEEVRQIIYEKQIRESEGF